MTKAVWPSAFVAVSFAIHPLHVESVAWIAERKDVLSCFFWLLTIAAYIRYTKKRNIGKYILMVIMFIFALMAKPMAVTLPFVLLLLDYWPLGRLHLQRQELKPLCRLIVEKIPLFVLSAAVCAVTWIAQKSVGAVAVTDAFPLTERISNALFS